ncbi:hypothetical protein KIL84_004557 [Mauremys mutica]|uniref:Phosphatidylserine Lipase ABHD16 N-terminal domain-containing protein n=1 Tax=Mauremys mutica TaxID=74926 RepID=A0A9D3XPX5_9SAUR|nr:hypothetical protein KIL84_004557 [Mauremys mutica]
MAKLLSCVLGPRLYRVYRDREPARPSRDGDEAAEGAQDGSWESYYQPRTLEKHADSILALASVLWSISYYTSPLAMFYLYRKGIGRWTNPQYIQFITILEDSHRIGTPEIKKKLTSYNFDFRSWPVDFRWDEVTSRSDSRGISLLRPEPKHRSAANGFLHAIKKLPCQIASYIVAHTFGRRMLYPGSVYLLQKAVMPMLLQGQARLVEENEANAMDVVMQYAIHRLGFLPEDIVVYAWSIGGFTATWAAMSYPDISALVLDASFDDLVPLALKVMPESCRGLVTRTVRQYLNLNNGEQLCRYPKVMAEEGVRVVREWLEASNAVEEASVYSSYEVDEDWCLSVLSSYQAERGGRFPWSVGEDMTPEGRRQLALFLARKHLRNFEATHCTPLPPPAFRLPWHL